MIFERCPPVFSTEVMAQKDENGGKFKSEIFPNQHRVTREIPIIRSSSSDRIHSKPAELPTPPHSTSVSAAASKSPTPSAGTSPPSSKSPSPIRSQSLLLSTTSSSKPTSTTSPFLKPEKTSTASGVGGPIPTTVLHGPGIQQQGHPSSSSSGYSSSNSLSPTSALSPSSTSSGSTSASSNNQNATFTNSLLGNRVVTPARSSLNNNNSQSGSNFRPSSASTSGGSSNFGGKVDLSPGSYSNKSDSGLLSTSTPKAVNSSTFSSQQLYNNRGEKSVISNNVSLRNEQPQSQGNNHHPPSVSGVKSVPAPRPRSLVIEETKASKGKSLPRFHHPFGNPGLASGVDIAVKAFADEFRKLKVSTVNIEQLGTILKACGYPLYWKSIVFSAAGGERFNSLSLDQLSSYWRRMCGRHHDDASQFVFTLTSPRGTAAANAAALTTPAGGSVWGTTTTSKYGHRNGGGRFGGGAGGSADSLLREYLVPEDLVPLIQDVVETHPGLGFLKEASEFHSRYVHTVIARIFFNVNRSWSGRISIPELRKSNFLAVLRLLEEEEDINQITEYFSYEHFYVIYCKFWELDKDHDLFIDKEDLARHNDHAISSRMIERIFSGAVTRGPAQKEGKMSYTEFVWFLMAEEDKRHPTSIEYWFRAMDIDGDGYLSMYELEYFYEEQLQRMEQLGIETLPFEDCLCQMLDMLMPKEISRVTLSDLKRCRMTPIFFDTFFNLEKYLDHEQRDPFASQRELDEDGNEISDWDRFAAEEYELLVAEEGHGEEEMGYDDEMDPEMQVDERLENSKVGIVHDPRGKLVPAQAASGNADDEDKDYDEPMMS